MKKKHTNDVLSMIVYHGVARLLTDSFFFVHNSFFALFHQIENVVIESGHLIIYDGFIGYMVFKITLPYKVYDIIVIYNMTDHIPKIVYSSILQTNVIGATIVTRAAAEMIDHSKVL